LRLLRQLPHTPRIQHRVLPRHPRHHALPSESRLFAPLRGLLRGHRRPRGRVPADEAVARLLATHVAVARGGVAAQLLLEACYGVGVWWGCFLGCGPCWSCINVFITVCVGIMGINTA
jgi:hypothetical protein